MPTCPAIKANGEACSTSFGIFGSDGKCYWHTEDVDVASHRAQTRIKGAKATARKKAEPKAAPPPPLEIPADPQTIDDARSYLSWLARATLTGQLEPRQAEAANKAIMTWIKAEDYARQIRELRKRVDDLKKPVRPSV